MTDGVVGRYGRRELTNGGCHSRGAQSAIRQGRGQAVSLRSVSFLWIIGES